MHGIPGTVSEYRYNHYLLAVCKGSCGHTHVIPLVVYMKPGVHSVFSADGCRCTFSINPNATAMPRTWFMSYSKS